MARLSVFLVFLDRVEPPHVHIFKDRKECKLWLGDVSVAFNRGYPATELRALIAKVAEERQRFMEVWHEQFGR